MISNALAQHLETLGGKIQTGILIKDLSQLPRSRVILLDVTPRQLIGMAGEKLPIRYRRILGRFRYGPRHFQN